MMNNYLPARYYQNLNPEDSYTDTVTDSSGNTYAITLTVSNWKNIDWINKHAKVFSEQFLVDDALIELSRNPPNVTLSDCVATGLHYYVKSFLEAREERKAKESGRKDNGEA